jgi:hypothetical protein
LNGAARASKEMEVSEARARTATQALIATLRTMPGGDTVAALVKTRPFGVGATDLKIKNPITEEDRRKNRRVVFKWSRCLSDPTPIIHPPIPLPHPEYKDDDNPNVVYAGNKFRIIILDGESAGAALGIFQYQMLLWDVDNKRMAQYIYSGINKSVGFPPFSECEVSEWSAEFFTRNPRTVDQFGGAARHDAGSVVVMSYMLFVFDAVSVTPTQSTPWNLRENAIPIAMGPSKSFSGESGAGTITYVTGSVDVLKDGNTIAPLK